MASVPRAGLARLFPLVLLLPVLLSGCATPPRPAETLRFAAQRALHAGSARMQGTTSWWLDNPRAERPFHGTLSWSSGPTAEFVMPSSRTGGGDSVARYTDEDRCISVPADERTAMGGKPWGCYPRIAGGQVRSPVGLAFPASFAALLSTATDLRLVGRDRIHRRMTRHYGGTVNPSTLGVDPAIGLTDELLAELRGNFPDAGEHLDVWLDPDGYPVRIEARRLSAYPTAGLTFTAAYEPAVVVPVIISEPLITIDYFDYGGPEPTVAPPADEVYQLHVP